MIRQCEPLWAALTNTVAQWAQDTFGIVTEPVILNRKVFSGGEVGQDLDEGFSFANLRDDPGPVASVTIDASGAQRYAASRLRQSHASLKNAPELFLRLMSENAARSLWLRLESLLGHAEQTSPNFSLQDYPGADGVFHSDVSYILLSLTLNESGGEDSWLIEQGEDAPQVSAVLKLDAVKRLAHAYEANATKPSRQEPGGREVLRERVRNTEVVLDAVLDSVPMTIGACSTLAVGQVIALPDATLERLTLSADTLSGSMPLSEGELGAWNGLRALRLTSQVPEHVIREIAEI